MDILSTPIPAWAALAAVMITAGVAHWMTRRTAVHTLDFAMELMSAIHAKRLAKLRRELLVVRAGANHAADEPERPQPTTQPPAGED